MLTAYWSKKVYWATWQFSVLKLSVLSLGIIVGAYFADFWKPLMLLLWAVFVVTTIWVTGMWFGQVTKRGGKGK